MNSLNVFSVTQTKKIYSSNISPNITIGCTIIDNNKGGVENVTSMYFPKGHNVSHLNLKYDGVLFIFDDVIPS